MQWLVLAGLAGFALSAYGWGWGFRRIFRIDAGMASLTIVLGLGVVICIGGILNLANLAFAPMLAMTALAGAALGIYAVIQTKPDWRALLRWDVLGVVLPLAAIIAFTVATQLPPKSYNAFDDYEKYFVFPVRMLATGTVTGSALSGIGSETLGGLSFLDGFALAAFPISYINAVDAVFGLVLCLMLAAQLARAPFAWLGGVFVLGVVFIEPEYVNISALYLGAACMMTAVALTADPRELHGPPNAAALGLLYAALVALKTTFLLFAVLHLVFVAVALGTHERNVWKGVRWAARCGFYAGLFVLPWIALHASRYLTALTDPSEYGGTPTPIAEAISFFSFAFDSFGARPVAYTAVVLAVAGAGAAALWLTRAPEARLSAAMTAAGGATLLVSYLVMIGIAAPLLAGVGNSLRYFTPFVIGVFPAVGALAARHIAASSRQRILTAGVPLALALLPVAVFAEPFAERVNFAWTQGSLLGVRDPAILQTYLAYNDDVLNGGAAERVKALQAAVPEGETIVAWIGAPFYLDFNRNPIVDANPAGIDTPWAALPQSGYAVWEYNSTAAPRFERDEKRIAVSGMHEWIMWARTAEFAKGLETAASLNGVVSNDGHVAVIRLGSSQAITVP